MLIAGWLCKGKNERFYMFERQIIVVHCYGGSSSCKDKHNSF